MHWLQNSNTQITSWMFSFLLFSFRPPPPSPYPLFGFFVFILFLQKNPESSSGRRKISRYKHKNILSVGSFFKSPAQKPFRPMVHTASDVRMRNTVALRANLCVWFYHRIVLTYSFLSSHPFLSFTVILIPSFRCTHQRIKEITKNMLVETLYLKSYIDCFFLSY